MNDADNTPPRDLSNGIPVAELSDGTIISGRVGDDDLIVVRRGSEFFAIGAHCTHYKGPLADGLLVDDTVRCPWHHACFSLRTGEAVKAPALDSVSCWRTEREADKVFIREKVTPSDKAVTGDSRRKWPESVVI